MNWINLFTNAPLKFGSLSEIEMYSVSFFNNIIGKLKFSCLKESFYVNAPIIAYIHSFTYILLNNSKCMFTDELSTACLPNKWRKAPYL